MYYSKYTVNWNVISHSEIIKLKGLVPYPILKLENKPFGANLSDKY